MVGRNGDMTERNGYDLPADLSDGQGDTLVTAVVPGNGQPTDQGHHGEDGADLHRRPDSTRRAPLAAKKVAAW